MTQLATAKKFSRLSGAEKTAILFLCLGEEKGSQIMQKMEPEEISRITQAVTLLGEVQANVVEEVMEDFGTRLANYSGVTGSVDSARELLRGFLPEDQVTEILEENGASNSQELWAEVAEIDDKKLAEYLNGEQTQTAAVILSQIRPDKTARLLPLLGKERSVAIMERMLTVDAPRKEVMRTIEDSLRQDLLDRMGKDSANEMEVKLVKVFNNLDSDVFEGLSRELESVAPEKIKSIRQRMFVFEDIGKLQQNDIAQVMRGVSGSVLPLALRGANKEMREHFLLALPSRARDMLREEMNSLGPVRSRDVKAAQGELVEAAMQLIESGEISIQDEDEDFVED